MIEVILIYVVTFVGGVSLSYVAGGEMDWQERVIYGIVNALIFGTVLFLAIVVLTALGGINET